MEYKHDMQCSYSLLYFGPPNFYIQWGWLKLHTPLYAVIPLFGDTSKQNCTIIPVVVTSVLVPPWVRAACSEGCFLYTCVSK